MGRTKSFDRNDVLDKAVRLFWAKGFADTSLHDLERATGVNRSGLYSDFKDKDDLFSQSLKRYATTNGVLELLAKQPLGRGNLENFLMAGQRCVGTKGCFMSNTLRELSIIPKAAKAELAQQIHSVRKAVVKNVAATSATRDHSVLADLILTYNTGLALRLNAGGIRGLKKQVSEFLDLVLR